MVNELKLLNSKMAEDKLASNVSSLDFKEDDAASAVISDKGSIATSSTKSSETTVIKRPLSDKTKPMLESKSDDREKTKNDIIIEDLTEKNQNEEKPDQKKD